eukprot:1523543-Lingulodinium_polyedra.AAC.1
MDAFLVIEGALGPCAPSAPVGSASRGCLRERQPLLGVTALASGRAAAPTSGQCEATVWRRSVQSALQPGCGQHEW